MTEFMSCKVCGFRPAAHKHHRKRRSQGGDDSSANILDVCVTCHDWIHKHPELAFRAGLLVHSWAEPGEVRSLTIQDIRHFGGPEVKELEGSGEGLPAPSPDRPICSGCGRRMPKPKVETPKEDRKPRGTWSVAVPMDVRENGADVIDELLEACEEKLDQHGLNWGHGNRVVYHKLATVLGLFVLHADEILGNE